MLTELAMNHTNRIARRLNVNIQALDESDFENLALETGAIVEDNLRSYDPLSSKTTTLPQESSYGTFFNYHAYGKSAQQRVEQIVENRCKNFVEQLQARAKESF